jgi:hypothetical protein
MSSLPSLRRVREAFSAVALIAVTVALLVGLSPAQTATAATGSDFAAGNIISDAVFYNPGAMSQADIQAFIVSKEPSCASGYTCLKSYSENVTSRAADNRCGGALNGGTLSASAIIYGVAQACGINPQVFLVILEKEQGLVSSSAPSSTRYQRAMGFACPDTAPCNTLYYGFANQVYSAAHQFKSYQASPGSWSYQAGRSNSILYNPNRACGSSSVYIQNQATAGLYIYTPYQPNQAALNNLYGVGDGCSSYGNRNFWRTFTDWFGSTLGSGSLVMASGNPNVYLVTGLTKYLIPNAAALNALMALGPYRTVSQQYLDSLTTGPTTVSNLLRNPSTGDVFFLDGTGSLHRFASCDLMSQLGFSCANAVNLELWQLQKFPVSGAIAPFIKSAASPTVYYLDQGAKRPIAAWSTVQSLYGGADPYIVTVSDATFQQYPVGNPMLGVATLVKSASSPQIYMIDGLSSKIPVSSFATASELGVNGWSVQADATLNAYTTASSPLSITLTCGTTSYVGASGSLTAIANPGISGLPVTTVSQITCDALPHTGQAISGGLFVKIASSPSVYYITSGTSRLVDSWSIVAALNGQQAPTIVTLSQATFNAIPSGRPLLGPATLVKSPTSPQIYMIDGLGRKVPVGSFAISSELGVNGYSVVSNADLLGSYVSTPDQLKLAVQCGSQYYLGAQGQLWKLNSANGFGLATTTLDPITCAALPQSSVATGAAFFVKAPDDPMVYVLASGQKKPIASWAQAVSLNGGTSPVITTVNAYPLSTIPTGPAA